MNQNIDNKYSFYGCPFNHPKVIGYWDLYPNGAVKTSFAMYNRPTDEQIKNTEALLGWGWRNAE